MLKKRNREQTSAVDEYERSLTKFPARLKLPEIDLGSRSRAGASLNYSTTLKDTSTATVVPTLATAVSHATISSALSKSSGGSEPVAADLPKFRQDVSASTISDAQMNKTIAAILPRTLTERDYKPSFYFNYKQSGTRIGNLERIQHAKSLKISAQAPKTWLKSKYMPNNKIETNGYLIMTYNA
jgi:hypothetical protein